MRRAVRPEKVPEPKSPPFELPALPLDLEIGCGVGWHPIHYASGHPERFLVAIEHTAAKFARFERRLAGHPPLPNLLPVHANAISWVTHRLPEASVERIFLLYPNPFPRWTSMPFFQRLAATLKAGGTVTLATNLPDYAEEARESLPRLHGLELVRDERILPESLKSGDWRPRTHFEKKYLLRGETCFDLVFRKSGPAQAETILLPLPRA
jgi:tRNA G46 methylase TrmB